MDFETKKHNGLSTIFAYLVVFYLVATVITVMVANIYKILNIPLTVDINYYNASSLINLIVYLILFVAVFIINKQELIGDIKDFSSQKDLVLKVLAGYGIFYAINIVCSLLVTNIETYGNFMFQVLGSDYRIVATAENQNTIVEILNGGGFWLMFLSAGIFGPICEEIVFRKAFFNVCKTKEMGILLSSLCFGSIHILSSIGVYDTYSIILMTMPYIFSGVALGILYIKNDCNIVIPTIVHMLSNIISMVGIMFLS